MLEETEKRERRELDLKLAAIEEHNNTPSSVEEIRIAKLKEIKQEKQPQKQELKRVQDKCTRHDEISSTHQEETRKLKEVLEIGHAIKDDILDTAERVRAHFAELDAMYNDLMKKMMAVNEAREDSMKHLLED